jgi:hypothetical protein
MARVEAKPGLGRREFCRTAREEMAHKRCPPTLPGRACPKAFTTGLPNHIFMHSDAALHILHTINKYLAS